MHPSLRRLLVLLPWIALAIVFIRTAWVSDDAYITFRTVDNLVRGHGAVFNVGERVQAYTHPLWMLLHVPWHALFGNPYYVTIVLSALCAGLAFVLVRRQSGHSWLALPLLIIGSKAVVEYSSSGLENPLSYLLVALFAAEWFRPGVQEPRLLRLSLLLALIYLNRADAILLVGPALALAFWRQRSLHALGQVALGLLPLLAWEVFSVVYYGFPFPNTAYAKLGHGIPQSTLLEMGVAYFKDSLHRDPVTLPLIGVGVISGFLGRRGWPLAVGVLLYMTYVLRIGGDFMSGRFLAVPLVLSMALMAQLLRDRPWWWREGLAVAAFGFALLGPTPMLLSGLDQRMPKEVLINKDGVADERAFFFDGNGLLHAFSGCDLPNFRWVHDGMKVNDGKRGVIAESAIGMISYHAGPEKHILDRLGLSDPVLARLPMRYTQRPRPGHYDHLVPAGYALHIFDSSKVIKDSAAAQLVRDMHLITKAPLFAPGRWKAIWHYNVEEPTPANLKHFRVPICDTLDISAADTAQFDSRDGFGILLRWQHTATELQFQPTTLDRHTVAWMQDGKPVGGVDLLSTKLQKVVVPEGIHEAAIYPWQNHPATKLREIMVR